MTPVSQLLTVGSEQRLTFQCPGCRCAHGVPIDGPRAWGWNGSLESPTLTPSILISYEPCPPPDRPAVCRSFVRDGRIQFCGDSKHELAGQTVPLPPLD